jgi:SpoVK/Ycf46/Vps4 family AAA+-type ATPase
MVAVKDLLDVIKSYKKWDLSSADLIIDRIIKKLEKEKKYKVAKELRLLYAQPTKKNSSSNELLSPSSVHTSTNEAIKSELYDLRDPQINLEDIVLSDLNQHIVHEIKSNHWNRDLFHNHNLDIKTRILLYWPPWTWKTLFAYALAGELGLPIMHVRLDQLISSYLWETWKNIRKIFEDASKSNCIIFLDEFDAVAKHRDDTTELWELKRVVTVLLQYIDHLNTNNILISATNHYHLLDSAIIRRFEYKINLWILDKTALIKLYSVYLKNQLINQKDLKKLAEISEGMSGAVIRQIIDKALKKWILETKQDQSKIVGYLVVEVLLHQLKFLSENQKKNKSSIVDSIKEIQKITDAKYTYKDFETITWIADSTLNGWVTKK